MPPRNRRLFAIIVVITGALPTNAPAAQTPARKESTASASIGGVYQFDAALDSGGNAGSAGLIFNGTYRRDVTREFGLGVTLRYDYENWRFSNPVALNQCAVTRTRTRLRLCERSAVRCFTGFRVVLRDRRAARVGAGTHHRNRQCGQRHRRGLQDRSRARADALLPALTQ